MIRVLLADDHPVILEGIGAVIDLKDDMQVAGTAGNGQETLELFRQLRPDVVLVDLQMPVMGGVEVTKQIRTEFPQARIIVLTAHDGDEDIFRSLQAGASGYLLKDTSRTDLLAAIRTVHGGHELMSPQVAAKLTQRIRRTELTARELEVLNQLAEGKSNQEIGSTLFISEGTVKSHVNNILSKLGVSDRTQAVVYAIQCGLIHPKLMKQLIVFDLDGTLAESKSPLDSDMASLLDALLGVVKTAVISGGAWPQFESQLLANLKCDNNRLQKLSLLPTCGTKYYKYDTKWELLYSEDFTEPEKEKIIGALNKTMEVLELKADKTWGEIIEDRGSQITFSALSGSRP